MKKLITYLKDVRQEMSHVTWPSRNMTLAYTFIVIAVSTVIAVYTGVLDNILSSILNKFI